MGGGVAVEGGAVLYPAIAPGLLMVGAFMAGQAGRIDWRDPLSSIPAFLTMIIMPFTGSITEGIAFGTLAYSIISLATGRGRESHWLVHVLALAFLLRWIYLAS